MIDSRVTLCKHCSQVITGEPAEKGLTIPGLLLDPIVEVF
jgi:hypothetical protein